MSERKVTPWYPPEIKPVNVGEYESLPAFNLSLQEALQYHNPYRIAWAAGAWYRLDGVKLWNQYRYWRGLTERAT